MHRETEQDPNECSFLLSALYFAQQLNERANSTDELLLNGTERNRRY